MADFFISYTSADKTWAEWIGYVLEEEGSSAIIQAWDFRPGSNFVLEMQRAATEAKRTIMVLSPDYLKSQFASSEWAAAFAQDPQGLKRSLIPVVVRDCRVSGLLTSLVHINLVGATEDAARELLLNGVREGRAKPAQRPSFPGTVARRPHKDFPGPLRSSPGKSGRPYMPSIKKTPSDVEKRRFVRQTFETIRSHFETALHELADQEQFIDCDFQSNTATDFNAEVFVGGNSRCRCRIRQGAMLGDEGITYSEGRAHFSDNSYNEILSLSNEDGELCLSSLMGGALGRTEVAFDLKKMTQQQAADYLWRRFVAPLER